MQIFFLLVWNALVNCPSAQAADYVASGTVGMVSSQQAGVGAASTSAFAFGLGFEYYFSEAWGFGAELLSSKPIESQRASAYLFTFSYRLGHWTLSPEVGIQALIDDRADTAYVDAFTGRPVKKSNDGFTYGLKTGYDFIFFGDQSSSQFSVGPSLRYLRSSESLFYNQLYVMLELKLLRKAK